MAMATDLTNAANIGYNQCSLFWYAGTLPGALSNFITAASPIFSDDRPNDRPVGDWLVLLYALSQAVDPLNMTDEQLDTCATYLFRMCLGAASAQTSSLISTAQATALLTAWNANFGT